MLVRSYSRFFFNKNHEQSLHFAPQKILFLTDSNTIITVDNIVTFKILNSTRYLYSATSTISTAKVWFYLDNLSKYLIEFALTTKQLNLNFVEQLSKRDFLFSYLSKTSKNLLIHKRIFI